MVPSGALGDDGHAFDGVGDDAARLLSSLMVEKASYVRVMRCCGEVVMCLVLELWTLIRVAVCYLLIWLN